MYLISAYFDKNTTEKLQEYICKIAEASGNSFMLDNNVPPHMTLTAIEARNVDVLVPTFENLNNKLHGGDISIISVGQFMPKVIYAAPYLNQYLFNLQQDICEAFAHIPETTISKYYRPLSWLPHITLGKTLTIDQMNEAVKAMCDFKNIEAQIVRIGLAKVNPHEDVCNIKLI
ncbi:2'-5' RNA ligase [Pseudobutyrivibrio ruminis]|uniref:2'-5' RNA ligase n=1 Tax=Pseudobutyrivibrio ruminis TaxID=46206 RepID=A0A1H7FMM3_9FIRM|nr:2'-5' RNA ligase family protein [Pseudobutyrivibrio ruminis]SEK27353.1 2'-5' RNA ligase [Pseudobutyrivibrio ruminis]